MSHSLEFEKVECGDIKLFVNRDGGWQLNKENGFHKSSPPRDYTVRWIQCDEKWGLYLTSYFAPINDLDSKYIHCILTVDTLFEYICQNKHTHYS